MTTVLLDTDDLGEAEEVLSQAYSRLRLGRDTGAGTRVRFSRTNLGQLLLDVAQINLDLSYDSEPREQVSMCRVHTGTFEERSPGRPEIAVGADEVTIGAVGVPFSGAIHQAHISIASMDVTVLDRVATAPGRGTVPVRLTGSVAVSPTASRLMVNAIDFVRDRLLVAPAARESELLASTATQYLATSMLATFPNTALLEPTSTDRHDSTPMLLRRAIAFIDDNAHQDISVTEIAAAVQVTPRALQYMFRRHRDCTPMQYLRRVRLHYAHLDLIAANPATATVTEIAYRWGFGHLRRFAASYRQAYGQNPRITLHDDG